MRCCADGDAIRQGVAACDAFGAEEVRRQKDPSVLQDPSEERWLLVACLAVLGEQSLGRGQGQCTSTSSCEELAAASQKPRGWMARFGSAEICAESNLGATPAVIRTIISEIRPAVLRSFMRCSCGQDEYVLFHSPR